MKPIIATLLITLLLAFTDAHADSVLMARSSQAFPEAMVALQQAIKAHGYRVTRVQRVDVGLKVGGFRSDAYRVVFFGTPDDMRTLPARYPELMPYLPLKVVIFAEGDTTLLVTDDPAVLKALFPQKALAPVFDRWAGDVQAILHDATDGAN